MASSPPDRTEAIEPATASPVAFALEELTVCWTQAYEAMARGDLDRVTGLLDLAQAQVPAAGDGRADSPEEAALRRRAHTAFGLLRHAMNEGMTAIREELGRARKGQKALADYGGRRPIRGGVGARLTRNV